MKIAMANDHAGTSMKNEIKAYLESQGHTVTDFGAYDEQSCDRISSCLRLWRSLKANVTGVSSSTA